MRVPRHVGPWPLHQGAAAANARAAEGDESRAAAVLTAMTETLDRFFDQAAAIARAGRAAQFLPGRWGSDTT